LGCWSATALLRTGQLHEAVPRMPRPVAPWGAPLVTVAVVWLGVAWGEPVPAATAAALKLVSLKELFSQGLLSKEARFSLAPLPPQRRARSVLHTSCNGAVRTTSGCISDLLEQIQLPCGQAKCAIEICSLLGEFVVNSCDRQTPCNSISLHLIPQVNLGAPIITLFPQQQLYPPPPTPIHGTVPSKPSPWPPVESIPAAPSMPLFTAGRTLDTP
jgi:hypothetical protein